MIFDRFDCGAAQGVILAHTLRTPGKTFKKGRVLSSDDLHEIQHNGIEQVLGARLEPGDVDEDRAALELARALSGPSLNMGRPVAGRCNLHADSDGLAKVNRAVIDEINQCDSGIVIATLSEHAQCVRQQAVASIKVIPFAVSREQLDAALAIATAGSPAIGLAPYHPLSAALILTETSGLKESLLESTSRVTRERIEALGGQLVSEARCSHTIEEVCSAVRAAQANNPDLILICGASITVDPADIIPSAIVGCGGTIEHFGMPVEPGNMLLLAQVAGCPVINLPGCSRSPKLNGLDWVMQRLAVGMPLGKKEILSMGVGGLIKDTSHRWRMREQALLKEQIQSQGKVAAIVLAAGRSSRMGEQHKVLARVGGIPMIRRVVDAVLKSEIFSTTVVTGARAEGVVNELRNCNVSVTHNSDYGDGLASSLKRGLSSLPEDIDGVMILLADMPFITATHINELLAEFNPATERDIVAPIREGRVGNPVIWSARYIPAMMKLSGDRGARPLLDEFAANVWEVPMGDDAIFMDVDTSEELLEANSLSEEGR